MDSPCHAEEHGYFRGKRIGIFGGSFDPVHEGHIHLATLAKETAALEEVWFLPCRVSPHKTGRPPTPGEKRVKWLKIAIRDLDWAKVETIELDREEPSFSYLTLETLIKTHPGNDWFWIMGGDQWSSLDRWKHHEILTKNVTFVVLARNGERIEPVEGRRLIVVPGDHPASSTAIREALASGENDILYLDPEVARLIARRIDLLHPAE